MPESVFSTNDLIAAAPVTIITLAALAVLIVESIRDKSESLTNVIALAGLVAAGTLAVMNVGSHGNAFSGMLVTGGPASFFAALFCLCGILTVMLSKSYITREGIEHGEYYALLLFAIVGMMLMAAAADLIVLFLGLELMSVVFYVLAAFARKRVTSNEAGLKYFLLGAFATGFLLYGIALVYGAAGTTHIASLAGRIGHTGKDVTMLIGLGLLLIGLAFKVAAVPFHMWVPDVYEGSPTTVTAFMSTGGKAAAFAAMLLILSPALMSLVASLREVLGVIAALSMILGNVLAISQSSIKRMLAYSSIAHAGYILVGVVAGNDAGSNGVLFYLVAYAVMNIGAFGILSLLEEDGRNLAFEDYTGLAAHKPVLAGLMAVFMFSLTGIPPFAGFFGKYYVFVGAIEAGYTWLAIIGVLMSVVSAYYYLRLVVLMYFKEQPSTIGEAVPVLGLSALIISAVALLQFGLFPSTILNVMAYFH